MKMQKRKRKTIPADTDDTEGTDAAEEATEDDSEEDRCGYRGTGRSRNGHRSGRPFE
ncbi:MAG: hypothetical protein U5K84_11955 [Alkalibacterium sp.]|nr:hypothetical protein [Alkalibacterium sp.]